MKRNSVPSRHIRCSTTPIRRARATVARFRNGAFVKRGILVEHRRATSQLAYPSCARARCVIWASTGSWWASGPPLRPSGGGGPLAHQPMLISFVFRIERMRRTHDPVYVRRQALASVRGRRGGRQRHAWSRTIPECLSSRRAQAPWGAGRTRRGACIIGNRVPTTGHRWGPLPSGAPLPPLSADDRHDTAAPMPRAQPSPPRA